MFRAVKKRKPRLVTTTRTADDEEEEDELVKDHDKEEKEPTSIVRPKSKGAKKTASSSTRPRAFVVPSLLHDDDEEEEDDDANAKDSSSSNRKKRQKRSKKRGMGFGGILPSQQRAEDDEEGQDTDQQQQEQQVAPTTTAMRYDKSTLEKLKSEQRFKKVAPEDAVHLSVQQQPQDTTLPPAEHPKKAPLHARFADDDDNHRHKPTAASSPPRSALSQPLPDFISLNDATRNSKSSSFGGDFISLHDATSAIRSHDYDDDDYGNGEEPMVVMTGEEADLLEEKMMAGNVPEDAEDMSERIRASQPPPSGQKEVEEANDWEDQVLRRAGVAPTKSKNHSESVASAKISVTSTSTSQLRDSIQSTLSQLTTQQEDLHVALERRQVDLQHAQAELQRHGSELQQAGQALEYYQQLRETLASWVGALRELQTKLRPLAQARWELERDGSAKSHWIEWENDMVHVLQQAQVLEQVVGRQPPRLEETATVVSMVDEFGRDVKSQQVLQREQRQRRRKRIIAQRQAAAAKSRNTTASTTPIWREDDSDAFVSDGEQEELRERQRALTLAFQVALEEMDEEYTDMANVVAIFVEWSRTHFDDYRNCFANLSLADLAGVLVDKSLTCDHHPLHWLDGKDATVAAAAEPFSWLDALQLPEASSQEKPEERPMNLVLERVVIPRYLELFEKSIYSLQSSKQSKSLAAMFGWLCHRLPLNGAAVSNLKSRTVDYLCQELQSIAIPILKENALTVETDEVQEAIRSATCGQVHRILKLLRNVLLYWAPHLPDSQALTETVLEFCSTKLLFLLSSLQAAAAHGPRQASLDELPPSPRECFAEIYHALQPTKWLDQPDYMLQGASIRAAAIAYGIHQTPI